MLDINPYLDSDGCIIDRQIVDTFFDIFDLSKPKLVKDTTFLKGGVANRADLLLSTGGNLENVVFDHFSAGSFISNTASNVLRDVSFIGSKLKAIKIRPSAFGDHEDGDSGKNNISFDISCFRGEVDIIGISPENMRVDSSRHLILAAEPFQAMSNSDLMNEFQSLIFDMLTILMGNKASYGVFNFSTRDLKSDSFRQDLEKLEKLGGRV